MSMGDTGNRNLEFERRDEGNLMPDKSPDYPGRPKYNIDWIKEQTQKEQGLYEKQKQQGGQ